MSTVEHNHHAVTRQAANDTGGPQASASYLAPIEKPKSPMMRIMYRFARRQFGMVPRPFSVFCARMPLAFGNFYGKVSKLDKKLQLSADTATLVRERVKSTNACLWCMDAGRWYAINKTPHILPKLDALHEYRASPLFDDSERAALDFAGELTDSKHVSPETFAQLSRHYPEREICEIVWLIASEHLYNISNHGLNIGSDGLCDISKRPQSAALRAS
ncbi:MAG: carboxymuconolactone decarboxylase family protein [Solirubrobacteraceae bacterium]